MLKKYIEIHQNGVVVSVCEVKECEPLDFLRLKNQAEQNALKQKEKENALIKKINDLEHEIKILKGEE